jgi:hypothetical protein
MANVLFISCFLPLAQFLTLVITIQAKIPAVIVFGDSSVDSGNNNFIPTLARSNFEPYGRDFTGGRPTGRFSNGRIATDFISQALGLRSAVPAYLDTAYNISDFAVGVTFASAATGYDNATSDVLVSANQVSVFVAPARTYIWMCVCMYVCVTSSFMNSLYQFVPS